MSERLRCEIQSNKVNIGLTGISKDENTENRVDSMFKKIMALYFPEIINI